MMGYIIYLGVMEFHDKNPFFQTDIEPTAIAELSPTGIPTLKPTVIPQVDSRNIETTANSDPDPVIDCLFDHIPTKSIKMKVSECQQTVECEIGSQWYLYFSKSECEANQNKYYEVNSPSYNHNQSPTYTSEDILRDYNAERQQILNEFNKNIQEISDRKYESDFKSPTYIAPTSIQINVPTPTCIPLPGGDYSICDGNKLVQ